MTWEWAFVIAMFLICISALIGLHMVFGEKKSVASHMTPQIAALQDEVSRLWQKVMEAAETQHAQATQFEVVQKLADDTKKLLSQANLGQAIGGRR